MTFLLPADEGFLADLFSLDEPLLMWLADATQGAVERAYASFIAFG